jgi:hypothetical protein
MKLLQRIVDLFSSPVERLLDKSEALTDEHTALQLARDFAAREGLPWLAPVHADYLQGHAGAVWRVVTNWMGRGHSVHVTIDDRTRTIVGSRTLPR